jgi:hypothetical protein
MQSGNESSKEWTASFLASSCGQWLVGVLHVEIMALAL